MQETLQRDIRGVQKKLIELCKCVQMHKLDAANDSEKQAIVIFSFI